MVGWDLIHIDSTQKASRIFIQINSRLEKLFRILIWFNSGLIDAIHSQLRPTFFGHSTHCWLGMTFFGLFTQVLTWHDLFWAFDSSTFPTNWFELSRDSSSISETWIDSIHGSSGFSRNWLRINSWLKWIPSYWFRSTHDSKCFPIFRFKSTHDSSEKHLILSLLMIRLWVIARGHTQGHLAVSALILFVTMFAQLPTTSANCSELSQDLKSTPISVKTAL